MKARVVWAILLVEFVALNVYTIAVGGMSGLTAFFQGLGPYGMLAVTDLLLALTVAVAWMWRDARSKGVRPLPYAILTAASGSVGLLVYLVRHGGTPRVHDAA